VVDHTKGVKRWNCGPGRGGGAPKTISMIRLWSVHGECGHELRKGLC
jgi:hypothetical protein